MHLGRKLSKEEVENLPQKKWKYKWEVPAVGMSNCKWMGTGDCFLKVCIAYSILYNLLMLNTIRPTISYYIFDLKFIAIVMFHILSPTPKKEKRKTWCTSYCFTSL
jgi:hypothetical protein